MSGSEIVMSEEELKAFDDWEPVSFRPEPDEIWHAAWEACSREVKRLNTELARMYQIASGYCALLGAPTDWQPIETAPKDGTVFWAYAESVEDPYGRGPRQAEAYWDKEEQIWEGEGLTVWHKITHWKPLPAAPNQQGKTASQRSAAKPDGFVLVSKQGVEAMKEVLRISDRKHAAWDEAKAAIESGEAK